MNAQIFCESTLSKTFYFQTTERDENVYGLGPREQSEYRVKYEPTLEPVPRVREVYPRHTFHGFGHFDENGKPLNREASIQLVTSDGDQLTSNDVTHDVRRPEKREVIKEEASVEIDSIANKTAAIEVA